jgi:hypothetical protein
MARRQDLLFLTGPFYYYALLLFALLGLAMWRITQSPFGLHLRCNPRKLRQSRLLSGCRFFGCGWPRS